MELVFMKTPGFIAAILLAFVAITASWFLGLSFLSYALTSLILVLASLLMLLIVFKSGHNLASWFTYPRSFHDGSRNELIARAAIAVKAAARGYYYDRARIADVLRTALALRFRGQSDEALGRFGSRERAREELTLLVGKNPRVLEVLDPREDKGQRRRFGTGSSREQEEYLSSLEEAIRIVSESGT